MEMSSRAGKIVKMVALVAVAVAVRLNEVLDSEDFDLEELDFGVSRVSCPSGYVTAGTYDWVGNTMAGYPKTVDITTCAGSCTSTSGCLGIFFRGSTSECWLKDSGAPIDTYNSFCQNSEAQCVTCTRETAAVTTTSTASYTHIGQGHCHSDGQWNVAGCVMIRNTDADDATCQAMCDADASCMGFSKGGGIRNHGPRKCYIYTDSASDAHCLSILVDGDGYSVNQVREISGRKSAANIDGSGTGSWDFDYCKKKDVPTPSPTLKPTQKPTQTANPYTDRKWEVQSGSNCCACFANDVADHATEFNNLSCSDQQALCNACENWWSMGKHFDTYDNARGQCVSKGLANACDKPSYYATCANSKPLTYPACPATTPQSSSTCADYQGKMWVDAETFKTNASVLVFLEGVDPTKICCHKDCGVCGGSQCWKSYGQISVAEDDVPPTGWTDANIAESVSNCCIGQIASRYTPCASTTNAPCVMEAVYKAQGAQNCPVTKMIYTKEECEKAAPAVLAPFEQEVSEENSRPAGCFWDQNGKGYFNNKLGASVQADGANPPWEGVGGICKKKECTVCTGKCRASNETNNGNPGKSFCYRRNDKLGADDAVNREICQAYWAQTIDLDVAPDGGIHDRWPCMYVSAADNDGSWGGQMGVQRCVTTAKKKEQFRCCATTAEDAPSGVDCS